MCAPACGQHALGLKSGISPALINMHKHAYLLLRMFLADASIDVNFTVITSRSVEITWNAFNSSCITGYLISYFTNASYTSGGNVTVNDVNQTSCNLTNLEEYTEYYIIVRVISNLGTSNNSNGVTVTTYTDSKYS